MIRIQVDRRTCNGYGNCVLAAETIFDLDDEARVVLRQDVVGDDHLEALRRAVYDCPTESISITTDGKALASETA